MWPMRPRSSPPAIRWDDWAGASTAPVADADAFITAPANSRLGEMITAGDADSDGYADLLAGAPGTSHSAGAVFLFRGGVSLPDGAAADLVHWQFTGDGVGEVGGNS